MNLLTENRQVNKINLLFGEKYHIVLYQKFFYAGKLIFEFFSGRMDSFGKNMDKTYC